jgi:hypothetical protein
MHAKLASSARKIGIPQSGLTVLSWGPDEKTAARLGQTTYRPMPVAARIAARLIQMAGVPRALTTRISGRSLWRGSGSSVGVTPPFCAVPVPRPNFVRAPGRLYRTLEKSRAA